MNIHDYFDYYEARDVAPLLMGALPNLNSRKPLEDAELGKFHEMIQDEWLPEMDRVLNELLIPFFEEQAVSSPEPASRFEPPRNFKKQAQKLRSMSKDQRVELYRAVHRLFWAEPTPGASVSDDLFNAGFFSETGKMAAKLWENYETRRKARR